ncbi:MAG: YggS family pyridoxal phosphate-dependent enzyme [Clostridia bacterium]
MTEPGSPEYMEAVRQSVVAIMKRMDVACNRSGRDRSSVTLLAVTKFHPAEAVTAAYAAGIRVFGENRVQEAESKYPALRDAIPGSSVHLLGHLQSNKARKAVEIFDAVQSVDSEKILVELSRRAEATGQVMDVIFELHTGEESKTGFQSTQDLLAAVRLAQGLPALRPRGLMTMAPYTDDTAAIRASFQLCRSVWFQARDVAGSDAFDILSMGMTNDFELAIEEGSTMIRIGTAIFGERRF